MRRPELYFKNATVREYKKKQLGEYIAKKDQECKFAAFPFQKGNQVRVPTPFGFFTISLGNSKVQFPTINFESGLTCSNASTCPYSYKIKRATKGGTKPLCYAQKLEGARPAVYNVKTYQAKVVERIAKKATVKQQREIITDVVATLKRMVDSRAFVRLCEVGDIGEVVRPFAKKLIKAMVKGGIRPYTYTKYGEKVVKQLQKAGAVVVRSDIDFVCVRTEEQAKDLGLPVCPGQCGDSATSPGCYRCPLGLKTAVIAH